MDGTRDDKYQPMVDFIGQFIQDHGYSPSIREMQHGLRLSSTSVVNWWMRALERKGRLTWQEGQNRTVRLVHPDDDIVIRLTGEEAAMFRNAVGHGDPKDLVMEAVRRHLRTKAQRPTTNSA